MPKVLCVHSLGPVYGQAHRPDVGDRWWVMRLAKIKQMSSLAIKTFTGLRLSFVKKWASRGRAGVDDASDQPRSGRPVALSPQSQQRLKKALQNRRFVTPARLAPKFGVSPNTIRSTARDLLKLKPVKVLYRCRQGKGVPEYRVKWCKDKVDRPLSYWQEWIWSDEKWFWLVCRKSGEYIWVAEDDLENEARYVPKDKHPQKLMVWAAISYDGRSGLHWFDPGTKVDSVEYQWAVEQAMLNCLDDPQYLFPNGVPAYAAFMQDGAGPHRSKSTEKWLADNLPSGWAVNGGEKWPASSPDLNPEENLWNFFQNAVVEQDPKTVPQFKKVLEKVWWGISQDYIRTLYTSMSRRCKAVIAADGRMTKY